MLLTSDEAGFNLLSSCIRTYAPCGKTPILQQDCKYAHLSVIGAISPQGKIITQIKNGNFDGDSIVEFLKILLSMFKKEIHLIWDGAKIHCGEAVKTFLATSADAKRLFLYRTPAYAPQFNPTEQLWNYAKNVDLKNVFSKNKTDIIKSFFKHPKVKF